MKKQLLNGSWSLELLGDSEFKGVKFDATIPGSVYSTLLNSNKMPDPFWRDNELEALKLMDYDFAFTRTFDIDLPNSTEVLLICEGLDTVCDIEINGKYIGYTDNMHRTWEFDIKDAVKSKNNELTIKIHSPTKYVAQKNSEIFTEGSTDAMRGFPQMRKAHCMFGWDWGPRLPDAGIWRDIYIGYADDFRLESVHVTQNHNENGSVELEFEPSVYCYGDRSFDYDDFNVNITITAPDGKVFKCSSSDDNILISNPLLWWPNGYGSQPLYTVAAILTDKNGKELDSWKRRIGLRTMTMIREKDEWGESFKHRVNGIDIFAMGADYIPEDNIFSRITTRLRRNLLEDCVAANFNTIRVWGGGYYPGDDFYDICDELGLIVWQDFMFCCAVYELTPEFEESIRAEMIDNVVRLRHHASLGLWCGNNELEQAHYDGWYKASLKQRADYIKMFEYIIPQIVSEYDPQT